MDDSHSSGPNNSNSDSTEQESASIPVINMDVLKNTTLSDSENDASSKQKSSKWPKSPRSPNQGHKKKSPRSPKKKSPRSPRPTAEELVILRNLRREEKERKKLEPEWMKRARLVNQCIGNVDELVELWKQPRQPWIDVALNDSTPDITSQTLSDTETESESSKLTFCSYNILNQSLCITPWWPTVPGFIRRKKFRLPHLVSQLSTLDADCFALQEADLINDIRTKLGREYDGISVPSNIAILWKTSKFSLIDSCQIEYDSANHFLSGEQASRFEHITTTGKRALLVMLNFKPLNIPILFGTTHLYWNPRYPSTKIVQTRMFLRGIQHFLKYCKSKYNFKMEIPVLIGGDFNSTPTTLPYHQFLHSHESILNTKIFPTSVVPHISPLLEKFPNNVIIDQDAAAVFPKALWEPEYHSTTDGVSIDPIDSIHISDPTKTLVKQILIKDTSSIPDHLSFQFHSLYSNYQLLDEAHAQEAKLIRGRPTKTTRVKFPNPIDYWNSGIPPESIQGWIRYLYSSRAPIQDVEELLEIGAFDPAAAANIETGADTEPVPIKRIKIPSPMLCLDPIKEHIIPVNNKYQPLSECLQKIPKKILKKLPTSESTKTTSDFHHKSPHSEFLKQHPTARKFFNSDHFLEERVTTIASHNANEPIMTNITYDFGGCLDYIFWSELSLNPMGSNDTPTSTTSNTQSQLNDIQVQICPESLLKLKTIGELRRQNVFSMPNVYDPSDHLPLAGIFCLKKLTRTIK